MRLQLLWWLYHEHWEFDQGNKYIFPIGTGIIVNGVMPFQKWQFGLEISINDDGPDLASYPYLEQTH